MIKISRKKTKKNRDTGRQRDFEFLLYPDNSQHVDLINKLCNNEYNAVGILHDRDIDEETGELKKPHWHFYIVFENSRRISGVADELGIEANLIQFVSSNFKACVVYFLHYNCPSKTQYELSELKGSLSVKARNEMLEKSTDVQCFELFNFINNTHGYISYTKVYTYAVENGYEKVCRTNLYFLREIIYDHNRRFDHTVDT